MSNVLNDESTPIYFNLHKKVKYDDTTVRSTLLPIPPSTTNSPQALNSNLEIRFDYNTKTIEEAIRLSSPDTCLRLRCTLNIGNSTGGVWQSPTQPLNTILNPNADVTFENAWIGFLFKQITLLLNGQEIENTLYFPIWFQLMTHIQPLDLKLTAGEAIGYIPDEVSGLPVDSPNPYLLLAATQGLAPLANGQFGIVFTNTTGAVINAGGAAGYIYTIPGTGTSVVQGTGIQVAGGIQLPLWINNMPAGATWVVPMAAPITLAANTTAIWQYGGGTLALISTPGVAQGTGGCYIQCFNSTGTTLVASTANATPVVGSTMRLPIFCADTNIQYYEPGYARRKRLYNYFNSVNPKTFEVMIPLYYLFGFCNDWNRLLLNTTFQIKMLRDNTQSLFIGAPYTDAYLTINEAYVQLEQIIPRNDIMTQLQKAIDSPVEIGFMAPAITQYTLTAQSFSQIIPSTSKPNYVFVIFKDGTITSNSQVNNSLNCNADIQNLQILIGSHLYPSITQDAKWNSSGNGIYYISRFYEQFKNVCIKLTGECSMSERQWRDLYPIFAFDLSAQQQTLKNTSTQITVKGDRNSNTPSNITMYVIVLYETHYEAKLMENKLIRNY